MLVFDKKTKIYNFLTKIKKTWGGGFGVGAGGDENLIQSTLFITTVFVPSDL